ncbi:MAG: 2'-5' RNA ligase family protein [Methanoregulaceae archaeon]|jgi:calcineurin-like phosphoesterase family protein
MTSPFLDNIFLIEIRLGRTKWRIKKTTAKIGQIYHIEKFIEKHPHLTLFGPFHLKKEIAIPQLLNAIEIAAKPFGVIPFFIHGYEMNQGLNGAVIAYKIDPTDALIELTEAIVKSIRDFAETLNIWDQNPDKKWFHVTIANRLDRNRASNIFRDLVGQSRTVSCKSLIKTNFFTKIFLFFKSKVRETDNHSSLKSPLLDEDGLRISVINGEKILAEYDLFNNRWVSQNGDTSIVEWHKTLQKYRISNNIELTHPVFSKTPDIYVISDLHLGHANIIKYCSRPFPHDAVHEMDQILIKNWNYTVKSGDRIFLIGDLCYGPNAKTPFEYLQRLNGDIILIQGNHDKDTESPVHFEILTHLDLHFLPIHDPNDAPPNFDGWIIHGHHHNNNLEEYPFINFEKRRINVSAEVIKYQPMSLSELYNIIKGHQLNPQEKYIFLR